MRVRQNGIEEWCGFVSSSAGDAVAGADIANRHAQDLEAPAFSYQKIAVEETWSDGVLLARGGHQLAF